MGAIVDAVLNRISRITRNSIRGDSVESGDPDELRAAADRQIAESIAPETPPSPSLRRYQMGSQSPQSIRDIRSSRVDTGRVDRSLSGALASYMGQAARGDNVGLNGRAAPMLGNQIPVGNYPFDSSSVDINDSDLEVSHGNLQGYSNVGLHSDGGAVLRSRIAELEAINSKLILETLGLRADLAIKKHHDKNGRWGDLWN